MSQLREATQSSEKPLAMSSLGAASGRLYALKL